MKRFQDLYISIPRTSFDEFVAKIEAVFPERWKRDLDKESTVPSFSDSKMYCFQRIVNDGLDSSLWLAEKDGSSLRVSNIVPTEKSELSISEYNQILNDFFQSSIKSVADEYGAKTELTSAEYSIDDLVNKSAAKALRVFSSCANKSTGSAHPSDRDRWLSFIILAYKDRSTLPPEEVEKFLVEDGWPQNFAIELAIEYEFGSDLLEKAEKSDGL